MLKLKLKKFFSYLFCLFSSKLLSDAINDAADADELDELVIEKAGF